MRAMPVNICLVISLLPASPLVNEGSLVRLGTWQAWLLQPHASRSVDDERDGEAFVSTVSLVSIH